ncbi:MAG: cytochrome c biogenesis protein CcsA [Candidatus Eisenbacteria bacterium]|nr:cytochrome c biogenesis protein CcsA [Candidatus Eisenbacteria bacterium]
MSGRRTSLLTAAALLLPALAVGGSLLRAGVLNLGQLFAWVAFLASLVSGLSWLLVTSGRAGAEPAARTSYVVQWVAFLAGTVFLWWILFSHQYQYQYVHDYTSRAMPSRFVYAAFWGGQEGTFLLWAFLSTTLGLFVLRWRHPLQAPTMMFLNLPNIMLGLVTVMRGPFLRATQAFTDGVGLNPLLQDYWMTIHPPVLFIGFSSFVVPFAIACAALVRRDFDGWLKPVMPWVVFSTAIQATGFIMGGVWAYKVLGWGGYWGWDPVENGSLIPWLSNTALLHGLLVQRVTGSLRRTNFFLAITSYVLVLYASFLTRSGVLADFSVHSFANLGLSGFLLSFIGVVGIGGYGLLLSRLRDIPKAPTPLGSFSRESFLWLGQLVFMLMCLLVALGMSAPLITRLFGPPANVQTSYYNLVNAPLAIALGLLLGLSPLMRWRKQEPPPGAHRLGRVLQISVLVIAVGLIACFVNANGHPLAKTLFPWFGFALLGWLVTAMLIFAPVTGTAVALAVVFTAAAVAWGVRDPMPVAIVFAMSFALAANWGVTVRGFRSGWRHGVAYLGHMGVAILLIGVIASSGYGRSAQVQLPRGEARSALGYQLTYEGMKRGGDGKDVAVIAVNAPEGRYTANAHFYWSDYNQSYMKNPHIERFLTHDIYISPLDIVGGGAGGPGAGEFFRAGESKKLGEVTYTFVGFTPIPGPQSMKLIANVTAETGGRTVPLKPTFEVSMTSGQPTRTPDYLPGGGQVNILNARPGADGGVELSLPGMQQGAASNGEVLAVEVSTKPFISLVWAGAIIALVATFLVVIRRALDLRREKLAA